jgi:hypothetical protein
MGEQMRKLVATMGALSACIVLTTAVADPFPTSPKPGVLGTLSSDGTFRPMLRHATGASQRSSTTVTGTLSLSLSFSIVSNLPAKTKILCTFSAAVSGAEDESNFDYIDESDSTEPSISGSNAKCTLKIPFEWHLTADNSGAIEPDMLTVSYSISASDGTGFGRTSGSSITEVAIPKSGKTTSFSVNTRI